ncbi:hypothetical protein KBZ10_26050 [Streptomyces sp. F63]|uniref:DUF6278 family protein n=1 Tax=Streptomyces sp. F63 TaxID=2824887 RepID=UPI001B3638C7|nr:DUF6278 family protein [Streptomyces sp. F63]MBQ0987918.1 hypothetical protein [Streptomyces sp. F63]
MEIPFLGTWRKRRGAGHGVGLRSPAGELWGEEGEGPAELLAECELLRARAEMSGIELDGSPASLAALDQMLPRRRDDPEELARLGNDAGLYLGTVVVRTVPGARWQLWPGVGPMVRLPSGRELDAVGKGVDWAVSGAPELSQVYAEAAEL